MEATASPPAPARASDVPWLSLAVVGGLFAVESLLLLIGFRGPLLVIPVRALATDPFHACHFFKWTGAIALGITVANLGLIVHRHAAEYRRLPLPVGRLAIQVATFVLLAVWIHLAGTYRLRPLLGNRGDLLLGAAALAAWAVATLAPLLPRPALAARFIAGAALGGIAAGAAIWLGDLTAAFWSVSGSTTMSLVEHLLAPFVSGPVVRPAEFVIGTPEFQVGVGPSCGGAHGIGLMTVLVGVYLWWFRDGQRFPQSLLLFPIGITLIWLANAVRITALILVGVYISPDIAVDGFHSTAGWVAFLCVGLGLVAGAGRLPWFAIDRAPAPAPSPPAAAAPSAVATSVVPADSPAAVAVPAGRLPPVTSCLLPFIVLMAATMLTRAFTSGFDLLYPLRLIAVAVTLFLVRDALRWREFSVSPLAVGIGAAAFAAWMLLVPRPEDPLADFTAARDPFLALDRPWAIAWLACRSLGAIVTVPIAEELAFRGFLLHRLVSEDVETVPAGRFTWASFLASSLAFGLLHGSAWIAATVAGMLFAAALYRRGRLADAVVAHATTNALLTTYVVATGSWSSWG